jgi:hypothetical protein
MLPVEAADEFLDALQRILELERDLPQLAQTE